MLDEEAGDPKVSNDMLQLVESSSEAEAASKVSADDLIELMARKEPPSNSKFEAPSQESQVSANTRSRKRKFSEVGTPVKSSGAKEVSGARTTAKDIAPA